MKESIEMRMAQSMEDINSRRLPTSQKIIVKEDKKQKNLPVPYWLVLVFLAILLNSKFSLLLLILIFAMFLFTRFMLTKLA